MKNIALASALLVVSLSACAQSALPAPSPQGATPTPQAKTPAPAPVEVPAFPVVISGPNGEALLTVNADGTVKGDRTKLLDLLSKQKGGTPQDNILIALLVRALSDEAKKNALSPATFTGG